MFKQLVIATDLSKDSRAVISNLEGLKNYGAQKCLLIQVLSLGETIGIDDMHKAAAYTEFGKILEIQKEMLEKQGFKVDTALLPGFPTNEINRAASKEDSLIVVGAQRHSFSGEVFFSALADDLIHIAQKPILLVRLSEKDRDTKDSASHVKITGCEPGNHVLFPTDFSDNADLAFTYITKIADGKAKKITLLHVQDDSRIKPHLEDRMEEFNEIDKARLQSMKRILEEKGSAEVDTVLKHGSPAMEILKLVKELDVQLVVMGSQGRGYVKEFFLGSVSHNVARQSPSSVLLIPAKRT
jgi:nucleotide-binding universal stress UspA family protein